jgi:hypothetical protein
MVPPGCFDRHVQAQEAPLEFIFIGGVGFMLGHWLTVRSFNRHLDSPAFETEVRKQLRVAFEAGMAVAADMTTMAGQEELAGQIRRVIHHVGAATDEAARR